MLEAATYILKEEGPLSFTTNKVAERAGVNIASLYQYYPNKESLLFHLIELQWQRTFDVVYPLLLEEDLSHQKRLHLFIQKFFEIEARERHLKAAISQAGYLVEGTKEYEKLWSRGLEVLKKFLAGCDQNKSLKKLESDSEFIQHVVTSFSENKLFHTWSDHRSDANILGEMICTQFGIAD